MPETMHKFPSRDWTILSLRPRGQHAATYRAVKKLGTNFLFCSPLRLAALHNDAALKKALACQRIVVTSPAAARFAAESACFYVADANRWFALGQGTAAVLKRHGVTRVSSPEHGSDSEALLALADLHDIEGVDIGLISAPGGRNLIEPALVERGAHVVVAHVYQRIERAIDKKQSQRLRELKPPFAVLCSSHEVFESFWRQCPPALREKFQQGLWVLSSTRLQALLSEAGILNSTVSHSANPQAMLDQLVHVQTQQVR